MPALRRTAAILAALPLAACGSVGHAPGIAAGYVSRQLCSGVFISGQDPETYYRQAIAPNVSPAGPLISRRVDRVRQEVTASFAGLVTRRAIFLGPTGCMLELGGTPPRVTPSPPPKSPPLLPSIAGPEVVAPADPALKAALDDAFAERARPPHRWTKAVVVIQDGRLIAERYAKGFGVETPIHGWSMTKSVTNALIGILVRQGRLDVNAPAPIPAWADPHDPRHAITTDNLLRMNSGLALGQSLEPSLSSAVDLSARIVFDSADMAALAQTAPLAAAPSATWRYADGSTILVSSIVRDKVGGDATSVLRFAHAELFDKLGLEHPVLEFDSAGTPIGCSHFWATARDWARFGLLYLNDGVVGGERILPEGWVDYSARPTPSAEDFGYGAGFWTNRGDGPAARMRVRAGLPADSFMARGAQGQSLVIIPSRRLVIVRLGMAYTPAGDIIGLEHLVSEVVAATAAPAGQGAARTR